MRRRTTALLCGLLAAGCTEVLDLGGYAFGAGGGGGAGAAGGGGGAGASGAQGGGGAGGGGGAAPQGGSGGFTPLAAAQPMPDSGTVFCVVGNSQDSCPPAGEPDFGQDGSYPDLPPQVLVPPEGGDIVIADSVTGLEWRAVMTSSQGSIDFDAYGLTNCPNDWRLPTAYELITVLDLAHRQTQTSNLLPDLFVPAGLEEPPRLWTTTNGGLGKLVVGMSESANCGPSQRVGLVSCNPNNKIDPEYAYVCVRGTNPERIFLPDLSVATEATTVDNRALLEWELSSDTPNGGWQAALAHCEDFPWGGHSDWRLPSFKEIGTLLDTTSPPPADLLVAGQIYWTSSPVNGGPTSSDDRFVFNPMTSEIASPGFSNNFHARCVRGPLVDPAELPQP